MESFLKTINKTEEWKDIEEYPKYKVSNLGRIISFKYNKPRILKQVLNNTGYLRVCLRHNNKQKCIFVHRLVASTFLQKQDLLNEVDHINEKKTDNRATNLRWCNRRENSIHYTSQRKKLTGAFFHKSSRKFQAAIRIDSKYISLGYYITAEEAHKAYLKFKEQL